MKTDTVVVCLPWHWLQSSLATLQHGPNQPQLQQPCKFSKPHVYSFIVLNAWHPNSILLHLDIWFVHFVQQFICRRMGWWLKSWINMFLSDWWNRLAARKLLSFESGKQVQKEHGYKAVFMPVIERIRLSTSDTWRPRKKRWKDWRSGGDNEKEQKVFGHSCAGWLNFVYQSNLHSHYFLSFVE